MNLLDPSERKGRGAPVLGDGDDGPPPPEDGPGGDPLPDEGMEVETLAEQQPLQQIM